MNREVKRSKGGSLESVLIKGQAERWRLERQHSSRIIRGEGRAWWGGCMCRAAGSRGNPAFSSSHPPLVRSAVPLGTDGLAWAGIVAGAGVQLEVQLEDVNLKDHVAERRRLSF